MSSIRYLRSIAPPTQIRGILAKYHTLQKLPLVITREGLIVSSDSSIVLRKKDQTFELMRNFYAGASSYLNPSAVIYRMYDFACSPWG